MPKTTQSINVGAEVTGISYEDAQRVAGRVQQYLFDSLHELREFWQADAEVVAAGAYVEEGTEDA